jgi:hypothetical protein
MRAKEESCAPHIHAFFCRDHHIAYPNEMVPSMPQAARMCIILSKIIFVYVQDHNFLKVNSKYICNEPLVSNFCFLVAILFIEIEVEIDAYVEASTLALSILLPFASVCTSEIE